MKKVLITGANSYIGTNFEEYVKEHYSSEFEIDTIDMTNTRWREEDFGSYDCVFHVAGLAHVDVGKVDEAMKAMYYAVNTNLAIETCRKAKADGVKQFVFMSSAIIYGDSAPCGKKKVITRDTEPSPDNFYGDSKWQADKGVRELAGDDFIVTVLRPPMIYGKGSKGNYPKLSRFAQKVLMFPDVVNERSMLYIENLCEFLCQVMIRGEGGIFWPQNESYANTSKMVKYIGRLHGNKVVLSKFMGFGVRIASRVSGKIGGLVNKVFGNLTYDKTISKYDFKYQKYSLKDSLARTELNQYQELQKQLKSDFNIKFSIITICFNSESEIRKTIESVLAQDYYGDVEYIIIDGASKDRTVEIAESYRSQFIRKGYRYIISSEPDNGIYDAMNKGIKKSTGDIVGIINSGDWYEKNALKTVALTYNSSPFDMFYADINLVKADGKVIVKHSRKDKYITSRHWNHPTSFVTKKTYEEIGLYRCVGIHDDFEFFLRVRRAGKRIKIKNVVLANFMMGGTSNNKSLKKSLERVRDRYNCYRVNSYGPLYLIECVGIEIVKAILS
ncbi:glycosyltransferase [Oribacterium sp. FC2011]|uniref:glycosyltransferase n=1 Tax=Oribacterium sp. FC2011 TaxID=1408311 RepID=UPI000A58D6E8|nr:glycosyltransferase [Oribacterium sp. FC2011]